MIAHVALLVALFGAIASVVMALGGIGAGRSSRGAALAALLVTMTVTTALVAWGLLIRSWQGVWSLPMRAPVYGTTAETRTLGFVALIAGVACCAVVVLTLWRRQWRIAPALIASSIGCFVVGLVAAWWSAAQYWQG